MEFSHLNLEVELNAEVQAGKYGKADMYEDSMQLHMYQWHHLLLNGLLIR